MRRVKELVNAKEIVLLVPEQVIHEYQRDRRKVAEETREHLLQAGKYAPSAHLVLGKNKRVVKKVTKTVKEVRGAFEKLIKKYDEQIENECTEADKLLKQLFKKARILPDSETILKKAKNRYIKGNPPRKNNFSYGDAIIWEILLQDATSEALTVISRDSDYTEMQKGKKALNSFLRTEWGKKTQKNIDFFESLGEFVNVRDKKQTIKREIVEEEKLPYVRAADGVIYGTAVNPILGTASVQGIASSASAVISPISDGMGVYNVLNTPMTEPYLTVSAFNHSGIAYCPYCGEKDPCPRAEDVIFASSRRCKKCGKSINLY